MTIPKRIWLQIVDEFGDELDPMTDEVTWCWDKINSTDVEYAIVIKDKSKVCVECGESDFDKDMYCLNCGRGIVSII